MRRKKIQLRSKYSHWRTDQKIRRMLRNIEGRCYDARTKGFKYYGGKGIRNYLEFFELEILWVRDGASHMKEPSIDRCDSSDHYTFDNCRFVEKVANRNAGLVIGRRMHRRNRLLETAALRELAKSLAVS